VWSTGCAFAARCPIARPVCAAADPDLLAIGSPDAAAGHSAACHASRDETWGRAA
jgi:ABC-type dipeptide/oligopeptide/nickel transport system ATPase component